MMHEESHAYISPIHLHHSIICLSLSILRLSLFFFFFFLMIGRPPKSTLFPSPPLFRSHVVQLAAYCALVAETTGRRPSSRRLERSEEHTSELQSRLHLVCRLLLEKK